ncbi:MAG: PAS domain-containing sensor histidine kinase [Deltaproteobacteria bacterium]|nr:PAS domain-containing sensor histidine kinase [Deltaproteobacteria bacterium]
MTGLGPVLPALLDALTAAGVGVVVLRWQDKVEKVYANVPAIGPLGYTPEEWLAGQLWATVAPEFRERGAQIFGRVAQGDTLPPAIEVPMLHKDGHIVRTEVAVGRVDAEGQRLVVLVVRSMAVRPQPQMSLLEADRISLVGALAAGFAHETNNPLTSVLLNLRTLRKHVVAHLTEQPQAAALRCLDDITTGSERIASNVRALQTLATRSTTRQADVVAVVSAALRLAAPTLEPRAHVIRQIFPVGTIVGDEARLGQAVLAMLLFSSSGFDDNLASTSNRIVVCVEERDRHVSIEVSDNGRELTTDEAQHAFDPFFRSSVRGAGVGVGLGIARSVAVSLGGDVVLAPRETGGAVITMKLPLPPRA